MLAGIREDPYLRTHPLTAQRIDYVRNHVEHSRFSNVPDSQTNIDLLKRIKVKLDAFVSPPSSTLAAYPEKDQSVLARYARAIAYYRIPKLDKALPIIDGLIRDYPNDPYYRELKGQMLFENGRIAEAVQPYEDAVRLAPAAPLLRISLAQVYIESNDPKVNKRAIAYLNDAMRTEDKEDPGLAPAGDRLRARQPDRHGRVGTGRGRSRCGKEKGRPTASHSGQGAIAEKLRRLQPR